MMLVMLKEFITLMLLLRIPPGTTIPLSSFYSYGSAAGDTQLPPSDDGSSSSITLPSPFLFFGTNYSTVFVNNNGYLSLGLAWSEYIPTAFPIPTYPVMALYLANVDTRGIGSIWYRITQNATLLAKAANNIRSLTGTSVEFQWLFIATWDHVGYYNSQTDKTNTFQAVLATYNGRSYTVFQYADGLIQWPSSGAQVGFNAGNNLNYANVPGSRTPYILSITSNSNVGVGGQWVFLISQAVPSCGVVHNYSEGALALSGYVKCYDQPYSSITTSRDLAACNDTQIVFVGAKSSNSSSVFAIGAFGSPLVFAPTSSTSTAYYHPGGAYWYRYPSSSFGFANTSSVNLIGCDVGQGTNDCVNRLCWHLDNSNGGYRAGCTVGLSSNQAWRKVIYKGNNSFTACNPDECTLGIRGCNQVCTNTNGSYVCSCYLGYQLSSNNRTCVDTDECALGISGCNQICTNTNGSYVCSCYLGYQISSNNRNCVDVNECVLGVSGCNQHCTNTNGSYLCSCYSGYDMSSDNRTCVKPCALYNETANKMAPSINVMIESEVSLNITTQPESVSASLNSQVTLICQMTGCPRPQTTWYKDNVVISNVPNLVIPALALSDRGFYICKSENMSSRAVRLSIKGVYQYLVLIELNTSATLDIVMKLNAYLFGKYVLNNSANIILVNISYSGSSLDALITLAGNYSVSYILFSSELKALLLVALGNIEINITSIRRFDGCPLINSCDNKYVWVESEIGIVYESYLCIHRHCGGTYSTGGQWEPVVFRCAADYVSCALSELEDLLTAAVNNTEVAAMLLRGIDNLLDTNQQIQDPARLLNILNYYSNNAIINETTVFTGRSFATQLEDINITNGCFAGRNFSVNLGSVEAAIAQNTTIFRSAISSSRMENTTASVLVLPPTSNECAQNTTSIYRLTFYTFLRNVLFQSTEQEEEGFKIGSIIISVGGNAISLAEKLQFSFQVVKDAKNAKPVQWINDSNQSKVWSTEGCRILSTHNNMFITEVKLGSKTDRTTVYQGNFAMLLDLNPGSVTCPAADVVTLIGIVLSVISLLFFLVTYICSKPLRRSEHGTVLINMSCALLCLYIVFLMAAYSKSVPALCGISAALVHYFMLVYFMWTAAEAVFLFFKLVKVLGSKINHFTLKAGLISWLVPLGIVTISVGAGYRYYYNSNYCRASELPFYLGFIIPFLAIYVFNWIIFIMIMVSLCTQSTRSANVNAKDGNGYTLRNNVIIAAGLALVLGLGWGFGLAASSNNITVLACSFQFLFSVFVGCQGLLILFFHGVRNKNAKKVWCSWIGLNTKSHTVTMSVRPVEGYAIQSRCDQIASLQHSSCTESQPRVSQDDTSCDEPLPKAAATEEKLIDEGSFEASVEKYAISIDKDASEKDMAQKKAPRSFRSLSLLKKSASGAIPWFRSDSQVAKVFIHSEDEADDNYCM